LFAALAVGALLWLALAWTIRREPPDLAPIAGPVAGPETRAEVHVAAPAEQESAEPVAPATAPAAAETRPEVPAMGDQHLLVMEGMFSQPQGPLEAYRHSYQTEPRDSAASDAEARVRAAFEPEQASSQLLRSVLCRRTICRLELSWRATEMGSYVAAMRRTDADFEQELAAVEVPAARSGTGRLVELYLKRKE
jgi:hypothetical protein